MCELLVNVLDRTSTDVAADTSLPKFGDVVIVKDNYAVWGVNELNNTHRVIRVEEKSVEDLLYLTEPQVANGALGKLTKFRNFELNVAKLVNYDLDTWLKDTEGSIYRIENVDIADCVTVKPLIDDPNYVASPNDITNS